MSDKMAPIPVKEPPYYKRGIYTAYSPTTGYHYFSLFNGDTVKLLSLDKVLFDNTADAHPFINTTI